MTTSERFRAISERVEAGERYRFIGESSFPMKIVLDATRLAAKALLTSGNNLEPELRAATEKVAAAAQSADSYEALDALREFHEVGRNTTLAADRFSSRDVTLRLVDVAWGYVFWNYHTLRKKRNAQTSDDVVPLA